MVIISIKQCGPSHMYVVFIDLLPLFNLFEKANCQFDSFKGNNWEFKLYLFGMACLLKVRRDTELIGPPGEVLSFWRFTSKLF